MRHAVPDILCRRRRVVQTANLAAMRAAAVRRRRDPECRPRVSLELQRSAIRIHHRVPLVSLNLLVAIEAPYAAAFDRLDALAMTAAVGPAWRPGRSRSSMTKWWLMTSHVPSSGNWANQRYTIGQGGKLSGISRHAMPPRNT